MKKLLIFTFVLGFMASCATQETSMQQSQSSPVDIDGLEYPEINAYETPDVETFELDNGIKFYLVEDKEVPLIDLNMIIKAGSFMVPDDKVGLNSILTSA
ncbi:MAG: hypothetical protein GVY02_02600, partial [Bacteroidetes bacterium]|nr:hypothetical protein [Bacteroidota bacterium]